MENAKNTYLKWLNSNVISKAQKEELNAIFDDEKEINERFSVSLEFGTAGMRGVLGMGTNRMNVYSVIRATRGLASYVSSLGSEAMDSGVVIAYDTRMFSTEFAIACAETLAEYKIRSYIYENVRPVPMCSFAVRELNATAGIMITASHNPKQYNGYKVYGSDGAQMSPEATAGVVEYIEKVESYFDMPKRSGLTPQNILGKDDNTFGYITVIGESLDEKYYTTIEKLRLSPDAVGKAKNIKIVYTPIHGAGYIPVKTMLTRMGIPVTIVSAQASPDPEFSTVKVPNPEEPSALAQGIKLAEEIGSNLVIGTDPDCDRMGIALKDENGKFVLLNGNQIGVLLMDYVLLRNSQNGTLPSNSAVIKTIVSTLMADAVAKNYGVTLFNVLTGFKFIGEKIKEWETTLKYTYMFGFEESYGSLVGTHARDKDAVVASMLFAEMACFYESQNSTVYQRLQELYKKYGYFLETAHSFSFKGLDGMAQRSAIMERIKACRPKTFGNLKCLYVADYTQSLVFYNDGRQEEIKLPKTNAMYYGLENNAWLCVRPSGTEPKLKIYVASWAQSMSESENINQKIVASAKELFGL